MRANTQPTSRSTRTSAASGNLYRGFFQSYGLRENPFNISPDPRYLHATPQTQEALAQLTYGITHRKGFILLCGETGTGKTTVLRSLQQWLRVENIPTVFFFNPQIQVSQVLDFVLNEFGVPFHSPESADPRAALIHFLVAQKRRGSTAVVILDEAQGFARETLEEIRLLLTIEVEGEQLLQVILSGQPELERRLRQPQLLQLWQRISLRCRMTPFNREQTFAYIASRLRAGGATDEAIFTPGALAAIHSYSLGIPRVMNLLCEHSLINAYAENAHPIPARIVDDVAREFDYCAMYSGPQGSESSSTEEWFSMAALARAAGNRVADSASVQRTELSARRSAQSDAGSQTAAEYTQQVSSISPLHGAEAAKAPIEITAPLVSCSDPCELGSPAIHALPSSELTNPAKVNAVRALDDLLPFVPELEPAVSRSVTNAEGTQPLETRVASSIESRQEEKLECELSPEGKRSLSEPIAPMAKRRIAELGAYALTAWAKSAKFSRYAGEWIRYSVLVSGDAIAENSRTAARGCAVLVSTVKSSDFTANVRSKAAAAFQASVSAANSGCLRAIDFSAMLVRFVRTAAAEQGPSITDGFHAATIALFRWLREPVGTHRPAAGRQQLADLKK